MIEPVARLRIELEDVAPAVRRRVDVPLSSTLLALHDVVQALFRWRDAHLFEFRVGGKVYGLPTPDDAIFERKVLQARNVRLGTLLDRGVERFLYVYDFGDDWRHDIVVERVFEGAAETDYPAFVDGEGRAPPDDVGGPPGFEAFLEAIADAAHEDHEHLLGWHGGPFDPEDIERRGIELDLAVLAEFRRRARAGHRTRKTGNR